MHLCLTVSALPLVCICLCFNSRHRVSVPHAATQGSAPPPPHGAFRTTFCWESQSNVCVGGRQPLCVIAKQPPDKRRSTRLKAGTGHPPDPDTADRHVCSPGTAHTPAGPPLSESTNGLHWSSAPTTGGPSASGRACALWPRPCVPSAPNRIRTDGERRD